MNRPFHQHLRSFIALPKVLLIVIIAGVGCTPPPEPSEAERIAEGLATAYHDQQPVAVADDAMSWDGAYAVQAAFAEALGDSLGVVVGYKAGLTSAGAQQRFGVDAPVRGVLLEAMLRPNGTTLPAAFGTRPLFEGDLLVRVGDAAINDAETDVELLAGLDAALPFLELPDLMYGAEVQITGPLLTAVNVGARYGIAGDPIPLPAGQAGLDRLANFDLMLTRADTTLATAQGNALLGHPIHVVRWLRDDLQAAGLRLEPGMLLSLGSLTPLFPAVPGEVAAHYTGLADSTVSIRVTLR